MWEVARCESNRQQFNGDGTVKIGISGDIGIMQVNPNVWLADSIRLGYNIYELSGNIQMAKYIYEIQGIQAWRPSAHCHGYR